MKNLLKLLPLPLALVAADLAAGQSGLEVTAGANYTAWDDDRRLDDSEGWLAGLGYRFNDRWGVETLYIDNQADLKDVSGSVDVQQLHLDLLYHFNPQSDLQPFVFGGLGQNRYSLSGADADEETVNLGAGVKYYLSDNFLVRGDLRGIYGNEDGDLDIGTNLALTYFFGQRQAKAAVAAAPVQADSDGDGVPDAGDACPATPVGIAVDQRGCALDGDKDGVADHQDQCPDTEAQVKVDEKGCGILLTEAVEITLQVQFDTNSAVVKPEYEADIGKLASFMGNYQDTVVEVQGHTDAQGADSANQALSQRRADAVRQVLIQKFGLAAERVTAVGYGEQRPIASNDTADGRAQNRRVVGSVGSQKTTKVTQ